MGCLFAMFAGLFPRLALFILWIARPARIDAGSSEGETTVTLEPLRDNEASIDAVQNARVELHERADGQDVVVDIRSRNRGRSPSK